PRASRASARRKKASGASSRGGARSTAAAPSSSLRQVPADPLPNLEVEVVLVTPVVVRCEQQVEALLRVELAHDLSQEARALGVPARLLRAGATGLRAGEALPVAEHAEHLPILPVQD